MSETYSVTTSGSRQRRPARAMAWLLCVLLVVVGMRVFVLLIPARVSHIVVPKFEFGDKFVVRGQWRPPYWAEIPIEFKPGLTESMTISMVPKPELTPEMLLPPQPSLIDRIKEWVRKRLPL